MTNGDLAFHINKGRTALDQGNTLVAMMHLESAARISRTPTVLSCLGFCIAQEKKQLQKAAAMCLDAIKEEPNVPLHYLNLARIQNLSGHRLKAIRVLQRGLKYPGNQQIVAELKRLGIRKPLLFQQFGRNHPLNKYTGLLLTRLGLR
ncbi:MAG: hypothetical protein P8X63_07710 [Desulfuromonadaceae bacterium]|jgi:Flp pilus assembly protein TadD